MKKYKIIDDIDFEKVAFATLKKVYSPTLYPKILTNINKKQFLTLFEKYAQIDVFLPKNAQNFAKKVHFGDYDIGLYFVKYKNLYLKIFDGNVILAGSFVTNIFDDFLFCNKEQFIQKKNDVSKQYKKLKHKKLLVQ